MKNLMRKLLALTLVLSVCLAAVPVQAAETASVIRLSKTEGTVAVTNSGGKSLTKRDDMRLYNGNHVSTAEKSYAWISLDDEKLNKLDEDSEAELRKSKRLLEVLLNKGNLFFNVTAPLEEEESLNIRTSTMVVGIRGTCGWVKVLDQRNTEVYILEGQVWCTITDPVSGQSKTTVLSGGESAWFTVYDQEQNGERCDIIRSRFTEEDIDGFVLVELVGDDPMCDKIFEDSGMDLRQFTPKDVEDRLRADQKANGEKNRLREELEAGKENHVSIDPVWGVPVTASSGTDSGSSSGTTPSSVVRLTMPVTDIQVQQALAGATQVIVEPEAGNPGNPLGIGINLNVPAGKTLTLEPGVPAEVRGSVAVDGTADLQDSLDVQPGGSVTVTSGDTLRVGGNLTNGGTMTVTATGRSVTEGTFTNRGTLSLTEGARVLARGGFTLTAAVPGWRVARELSGGYYILEAAVPQKSTLTLNYNNGDDPGTVETDDDGRLTAPLPDPTDPDGGTFKGWFTEDGATDPDKQVTRDTVFTGDVPIYAVWERTAGDFKVTGGGSNDFSFARDGVYGTLTVNSDAPLTISMADGVSRTTTDHICIADGVSADITLDGVDIDLSGTGDSGASTAGYAALEIDSSASAVVRLKNVSTLKSGFERAGLEYNDGTGTLTIEGPGTLNVYGGSGSAGIGGAWMYDGRNITIAGGTILARSRDFDGNGVSGASIGGGSLSNGDNITIAGGTVTTELEGELGTDIGTIGGGFRGATHNIRITGGTLNSDITRFMGGSSADSVIITGGTVNGIVEVADDGFFTMTDGILTGYIIDYAGTSTYTFTKTGGDIRTDDKENPTPPGWKWEDDKRDDDYYHLVLNTDTGDFVVTGGEVGTDYIFDRDGYSGWGTLTIRSGKEMTISMAEGVTQTKRDRIYIEDNVSANITLNGVNIDVRENGGSALRIADDSKGNNTITVSGDNELTSGQGCAAVQKVGGAESGTLTIQGDGTLKATGGEESNAGSGIYAGGGAGIGAPIGEDTANIVIAGNVRITAGSSGLAYGIGISESFGYHSYSVTIRGGTVDGTIQGDDVAVSGGTVNGSVDVSSGTFTMTGGTLTGYVSIGNDGTFTKTGGDIRTTDRSKPTPGGWKWEVDKRDGEYYYLVPDTGDFLVTSGTPGRDYRYANNTLTILEETPLTIFMAEKAAATTDRICIAKDVSANITLNGVNIDLHDTGAEGVSGVPAMEIVDDSGGNVTVTLVGSNDLVGGYFCAGLQKNGGGGMLTIQGDGSLNAAGGAFGAGIGGGWECGGSNITISGDARVTAAGGSGASGIGGGFKGIGDNITISGAAVTAIGAGGAGIGDGSHLETGGVRTILLKDSAIVTANRTSTEFEGETFTSAAIGGGVINRGEGLFENGEGAETSGWNAVVTVRDSGIVRVYGKVTITEPLEIGDAKIYMSFTPMEESFPTEYLRGKMAKPLTKNGDLIDLTNSDELKKVMPMLDMAGLRAEAYYEQINEEDEYNYLYYRQVMY